MRTLTTLSFSTPWCCDRELVGGLAGLPSAAHVDADMDATSVYSGSESMRSTSSCGSDYSSSASEGSMAALPRVNKRWEEPPVALQEEAEVKPRLAEEDSIESTRQLRDNIAKCVNDLSPTRSAFKKNKLQGALNKSGVTAVCRFLKNPLRLFKDHKGHPAGSVAAAPVLSHMRSAPWKARPQIQFGTVQSTQRDVEAWTMEEYMTRNARVHKWDRRKDDELLEELGGIEGNNLMNQYFGDDVRVTYDSDSD